MINFEILEERPISMAEAKAALEKMKKRDKELNFRANRTHEYISQFHLTDAKKTAELTKKIEGLEVPRLREHHIAKIVDTMPQGVEDLKVILQGYVLTVNNDNMKKIVATVAEYLPKK